MAALTDLLAEGRSLAPAGDGLLTAGLVAETRVGSQYLRVLQRAGEAGEPRTEAELVALVEEASGRRVRARRRGSMAYLVAS